ncbi:MAG: hypothetical protein GF330_10205, partial [Candidatus Eisenbacteria bacterium]|nr:hypothetical protein [Candidatus Eisenbacteria bacterium]
YGLHVGAWRPPARARLREIKSAREGRGFILLIADPGQLDDWVAARPGVTCALIEAAWPGPLTLVLPAREGVPEDLRVRGSLALRCPASPLLRATLHRLPGPLLSTSANRSGEPPPARYEQVAPEIREACDLRVDGGQLCGEGSTILRPEPDGSLRLLRAGLWDPGPWRRLIRPRADEGGAHRRRPAN